MIYKCEYCESEYEGKNCPYCGASHPAKPTTNNYATNRHKTNINTVNVTIPMDKKRLTEQPWFVIFMLFFFFPVGLYIMWKNHVFNILTRIIITSFFAFIIYSTIKTGQIDTTNTAVSGDDNPVIVVTNTPTPTPTPTLTPTPTPIPLSKKEKFIKKVTKISGVNKKTAGNLYNLLRKEMGFDKVYITQKSETGKANYDFYADKFDLTVTFKKDEISAIKWGFYVLYDGNEIKIDKEGLLDRQLKDPTKYYLYTREIITNNIKTPKTADFPPQSLVNMQRKGDLVGVQGYFDSQNIYGAFVRSKYTIEISVTDLDKNIYKPVYIDIDGEITGKWTELD